MTEDSLDDATATYGSWVGAGSIETFAPPDTSIQIVRNSAVAPGMGRDRNTSL